MIELHNVRKSFQQGRVSVPAVDGVSLSIARGQIFGVIGYSGAGKSTLIRLINGLEHLDSGTITVGELDVSRAGEAELRRARPKIGMIFQHFNLLWSRTVAANIAFALEIAGARKADIPGRVAELIKLVGLEGREHAYPSQLSGGQKQRVGIARALANRPDVLLCDEATSALDPETTDAILDLLSGINRQFGLTIVLITHEMHVVRRICDQVAVMDAGRIVEAGAVSEVFARPQSEVTQRFLRQLLAGEGVGESLDLNAVDPGQGALVKLTYMGPQARQAALADAIRHFDLPINILHGRVSRTREASVGDLYVQIPASDEKLEEVLAFLRERDIASDIIGREKRA
ncbi:methionine ABC transporter ATP-binding protein [Pelagibacterium lacus]|uniref:Cell division ATP-binding protein FtsE n=1 Tax=Pelagibacterium lacus TaxID=2282655 RepID=A0A369VZL4_9HYPH|nr:ATP-binding cassette domain-containing protein [Pelagibacterium lacus]RDE07836.1 ATP-binding cassette domain-containing protein [Pelagibacterium lacus]